MSRPHDPPERDAEPRARRNEFPYDPNAERREAEERQRHEPRRPLDRRPRPRLRRLGRGALAGLAVGGMVLLTLLMLRYSRQSLEQAAASSPAPVAPRPVDLRRLEELRVRLPAPPAAERVATEAARPLPPPLPPPPPAPARDASDHRAAWRSPLTTRTGEAPGPAEPQMPAPAELSAALDALAAGRSLAAPGSRPSTWLPRPADPTSVAVTAPPPAPDPPSRNLLPAPPRSTTHHAVLSVPPSPYLLRAGELLPAVLAQRVVSDQPGTLRAVVSRDVRDSLSGTSVLVPRGTVLLGRQGSLPGLGQSRLAVVWTRLLFPDGRSLDLDSAGATPAASAARDGTAGLRGRVDHHWGRRYAAAALLSLVGAGVQLSQPQSGNLLEPDTPGARAAGALGVQLGRTSENILRRYGDVPPTIELAPGARVHAVLLQDLVFASPYQPLHH